ncbi:glycosyltransferase [Brevundimonas sp. VNH65]|uniref:glycosyltransferase n=1 Tax=Brevundimonas sp. VNH65 TaxID=3400917 RepID=UPI003C0F87EF
MALPFKLRVSTGDAATALPLEITKALRDDGAPQVFEDGLHFSFRDAEATGRLILDGNRTNPAKAQTVFVYYFDREKVSALNLSASVALSGPNPSLDILLLYYDDEGEYLDGVKIACVSAEVTHRLELPEAATCCNVQLRLSGAGSISGVSISTADLGVSVKRPAASSLSIPHILQRARRVVSSGPTSVASAPAKRRIELPQTVEGLAEKVRLVPGGGVSTFTTLAANGLRSELVIAAAMNQETVAMFPAPVRPYLGSAALGALGGRNGYQLARDLMEREDLFADVGALDDAETRRLMLRRGRIYYRTGSVEEACNVYRRLLADDPLDGAAFMGYLLCLDDAEAQDFLLGHASSLNYIKGLSSRALVYLGQSLLGAGAIDQANARLHKVIAAGDVADGKIGLGNLYRAMGCEALWLDTITSAFAYDRTQLTIEPPADGSPFFFGMSLSIPRHYGGPKVTVVTTAYNAERTIRRSIESVLAQTSANLEYFIVDDVSSDGTRAIIAEMASADSRIRPLFLGRNGGTYVAKNQAIAAATGDYITFHDSDDWMHPQRIEAHLRISDGSACSTSNWVRVREDGQAMVQRGAAFVHLNPASTFVPRELFGRIGAFDNVRAGADAEFLARIRASGTPVRSLQEPLGIGLEHGGSLTQSGATAFDAHRYSPVRSAYVTSWLAWHIHELISGRSPAIISAERAFDCPRELSPH